ncbi:MAG: hypothetical protein ACLTDX_09240 [[Clostridium] innocuum]
MSMVSKTFRTKDYNIGYLPEERGLYPKKKVSEQLIYLATLRGLSHGEAKANLKKWLKRLGIEEYENRIPDTLSGKSAEAYSWHRHSCAIRISSFWMSRFPDWIRSIPRR